MVSTLMSWLGKTPLAPYLQYVKLVGWTLLILAVLASYAWTYRDGVLSERAEWESKQLEHQVADLKKKVKDQKTITQEVVKYVEKIRYIERNPTVLTDRIERMCRDQLQLQSGEHTGGDAGASPGSESDPSLRSLAAEQPDNVENADRLNSLIEIIRKMRSGE